MIKDVRNTGFITYKLHHTNQVLVIVVANYYVCIFHNEQKNLAPQNGCAQLLFHFVRDLYTEDLWAN